MPSNILVNGVDTDTLFAAFVTNSPANNTGYQVSGTDIRTRYDIIANPAQANAGSRVPATGFLVSTTGYTADTDLASVFCGNASQYSISTPANGTRTSTAGWTAPRTWTHTLTVTFANAAALTNYFFLGGRIQITPSQSAGNANDTALAGMLTSVGTLIIYDQGHYRTGAGGTIVNAGTGGSNIGTTSTSLYTVSQGLYTDVSYAVTMVADAAAGAATVLTITITLNLATSVSTVYTGTYTSTVQQRNHPSQAVPTFGGSMADTVPTVVPVANFTGTPASGSIPLDVTFTDTSTNTPTSWLWDFGDSTTSTLQNPTKTYSTAGTYSVTLTATNATGSNAFTRTDYISATADTFLFTISAHQANANLRTLAVNAGWNQSTPVVATIAPGYYMSSTAVGTPGLTVNGSFPGGVTLINNGVICGMGGAGSAGRQASASAGQAGGLALLVSVPVTINNASGTIAGGGGGGGGGGYGYLTWVEYDFKGFANNVAAYAPGGGGAGGRATLSANSSGAGGGGASYYTVNGSIAGYGSTAGAGGAGTYLTQGAGGAGAYVAISGRAAGGGTGGSGGGWGAAGSTGGTGGVSGAGSNGSVVGLGGGAGGAATSGNANITWTSTGTRLGAIG